MTGPPKRPRGRNQLAKSIIDLAAGKTPGSPAKPPFAQFLAHAAVIEGTNIYSSSSRDDADQRKPIPRELKCNRFPYLQMV